MVTTKTTSHSFTTPGGSNVVCTITRTYGNKHIEAHDETIWVDQPVTISRPAKDEFVDESTINVSINGKAYGQFRYSTELRARGVEGRFHGLEHIDGRQRIILLLEAEDDKIIYGLITERLNADISAKCLAEIEEVKCHIANNTVLPKAELEARRKEYRDGVLEGGEGFNPYSYYITKEYADRVVNQFPEQFN